MAFQEFLIGKRERLSWVAETGYGSGGSMSSGEVVGLDATMDPNMDQNWIEVLSAGADNRTVQNRVLGPYALGFTLTFTPVNWKFLKYCGYNSVDTGANPYTHTFGISNLIQSFKLEWARRATTSVVLTFIGCTVITGSIAFTKATGAGAGEGMIKVTLKCVAKDYSIGSSVTSLSNISAQPFQWRHTKFTLGSSEVIEVNSGDITIEQGIEENDSRYCNVTADRLLSEPIAKVHRISGRTNVNTKDVTYQNDWDSEAVIAGTNKLEFIRGVNDSVALTFSNFRMSTVNMATQPEGVTSGDIIYTAETFSSLVAIDSNATY